jgi:hypothetical protein
VGRKEIQTSTFSLLDLLYVLGIFKCFQESLQRGFGQVVWRRDYNLKVVPDIPGIIERSGDRKI